MDTLFPYTTLFRSGQRRVRHAEGRRAERLARQRPRAAGMPAGVQAGGRRRSADLCCRRGGTATERDLRPAARADRQPDGTARDRKSGGEGKGVAVSVDLGGRLTITKKQKKQ